MAVRCSLGDTDKPQIKLRGKAEFTELVPNTQYGTIDSALIASRHTFLYAYSSA
jgi:hypothetical protein